MAGVTPQKVLLSLVIVLVIWLCYKWFTYQTATYERYLEGFWIADSDEFCEEVEVDSIMIYFGPSSAGTKRGSVQRECYVIMTPEVESQAFTLSYKPQWASPACTKYKIKCEVTFEEEQIWEDTVEVCFDMRTGYLSVCSNDTKFAVVHKEHSL